MVCTFRLFTGLHLASFSLLALCLILTNELTYLMCMIDVMKDNIQVIANGFVSL
ncbi:hypothetical protein AMTRI_Chr12g239990 [Amborella trichopoda]